MVTLYYLLGILYTFIAYIWFVLANEFQTKANMPKFLMSFAVYVKRVLFWIFDVDPLWKKSAKIEPNFPKETNITQLYLKKERTLAQLQINSNIYPPVNGEMNSNNENSATKKEPKELMVLKLKCNNPIFLLSTRLN